MTWLPGHGVGLWNAWLFMILYPLEWVAVLVAPKHIAERTSHVPDARPGRQDRILELLTQGLWIGATLYSVFVPLRPGTPWFWPGLGLFVAGVAVLTLARISVAATRNGVPFTSGIYRCSRHPMYLSMLLVYLGVSLTATSLPFLLITVATFFLQRHQALKEEAYCTRCFGRLYSEYLAVTPRWIGTPSRGRAEKAAPMGAANDDDPLFGRMNDPTASAWIKGPCGDEMEFYLLIHGDRIEDVRYHTEGCENTRSCGRAVARRAKGRTVTKALLISAGEIIQSGACEPVSGRHCAILAVTALYRAVADYLLAP